MSFFGQQPPNPIRMTHSTLRKNVRRTSRKMGTAPDLGPRPDTIRSILDHSKALRVVDAPPVGKIDLYMN